MAGLAIGPPDPFDGQSYFLWVKRLERYFKTCQIADEARKINLFFYLFGDNGEQTFKNAHLSKDHA